MPLEPVQYLRLELEISVPYSVVLEGLDAWFKWELISQVDFKWRNNRSLANRLTIVAVQNDAMLQGLGLWLELGLITEKSVKLICETRFVCDIKVKAIEPAIASNIPISASNRLPANISGSRSTRSPAVQKPVKPKAPQEPNRVAQIVGSLFSEFSTMWLLFLGVFLVVVSSGLLAASQWDNFSPQIQYLLLLAYTLGFFGVSFWTSKNERLRMTTRALQLVTLLLVPANFWAMDGLGLLTNPAGIGLSAISGCVLSAIAVFLLQTSFVFQETRALAEDLSASKRRAKRQLSQISIVAILLLGWLHLGWFLSASYPLIAVYLGISAIATSTFLNRGQNINTADSSTFPLVLITGAYSTVLLISRALLFGNVSVFKLGLAFGICGWVLVQITNKAEKRRSPSEKSNLTPIEFQANLGKILLGLGWFVSVWDQYPWQTFAISLLTVWMLGDRLIKLEKSIDLTYLFFWVLQIFWLVQRLIPNDWKGAASQQLLTFFQAKSEINLFGVLLFPYLICTLVIAAIYRDRQKPHLANTGELLALGFGVLLTTLSIGYPLTIFVNLGLSATTLLIVQARRSPSSKDLYSLIYFTHLVSLSAIVSGSYFFTRSTSIFGWAGFFLVAVLVEWSGVLVIGKFIPHPQSLALGERQGNLQVQAESSPNLLSPSPSGARGKGIHLQAWRNSAWHIGASLAALSYILLWSAAFLGQGNSRESLFLPSYWGAAWLIVPMSLTFLGTWREFTDRDLAIKLSITGLAIAQFLTWQADGSRVVGLGVALALMLVNTRRSKSLLITFITVGYGLLFIASLLWQFKFDDGLIAQLTFSVNGAVVSILLLYMLNRWLKYRRDRHVPNLNLPLNQFYSQAFDIWAAILSEALLIFQTFQAVFVFGLNQDDRLFVNLLPSIILVTLGLIYRIWQDTGRSPFWTGWGIVWSIELLASGAIAVTNGSVLSIGYPLTIFVFTNLALSATTLLIVQARRSPSSKDLYSLIYFTHLVSLSAIVSGSYFFTRSTSIFGWAGFFLVAVLVEWSGVLVIGKFIPHPQSLALGVREENLQVQAESSPNLLSPSPSAARGKGIHLQAWRNSAWHIGASLAVLSYILLWNAAFLGQGNSRESLFLPSYWGAAWLIVPMSLTFLGTWREFTDRDLAIKLSITGLAIGQFLTWQADGSRVVGLGVALALMLVNTRRSKSLLITFITVGYGLLFIASLLWQFKFNDGLIAQLTFSINGAVASVLLLYMLNHWLKYRRDRHVPNLNLPLNQFYSQAFDIWAAILSAALLIFQTFQAAIVFGLNQDDRLFVNLLPSIILVTLGLIYRVWQDIGRAPFWTEWGIAWSIELLASGAIAFTNGSVIELAIANIALGFVSQLCGDWWMQRSGKDEYPRSWDIIPLIYGVIGSLLRIGNFSSFTGLFSLITSLIGIGIGRRSSQSNPIFKVLTYVSMVVATFSAYELLFYQMVSSSEGGSLGDGLVILATLGCAIAYAYKIFTNWLAPYLKLSIREIHISAHLHWTASAIFLLSASFLNPSETGGGIGGGIAIALAAYAIAQGKRSSIVPITKMDLEGAELWIYTGITTAIGAIAYLLFFAFPNPWLINNLIQPYAAAIACIIAVILYLPDWEEWGWSKQPWHNSAFGWPLVFIFITQTVIATPCYLIVGIFYLIYAKLKEQIRITYIAIFLWNWAIFQNLSQSQDEFLSLKFLIYICVIGFSGLYFVQVEPNLQSSHTKALRHTLRSLLSGGMGLFAFIYSFNDPSVAIVTWGLSFAFIIAGLGLRVRAYLFMGTLTFVLLVITQAVTLVSQYSFLMWALGIVAGIGLILVGANFEVRRDRIIALFENVAIKLETWD